MIRRKRDEKEMKRGSLTALGMATAPQAAELRGRAFQAAVGPRMDSSCLLRTGPIVPVPPNLAKPEDGSRMPLSIFVEAQHEEEEWLERKRHEKSQAIGPQ